MNTEIFFSCKPSYTLATTSCIHNRNGPIYQLDMRYKKLVALCNLFCLVSMNTRSRLHIIYFTVGWHLKSKHPGITSTPSPRTRNLHLRYSRIAFIYTSIYLAHLLFLHLQRSIIYLSNIFQYIIFQCCHFQIYLWLFESSCHYNVTFF